MKKACISLVLIFSLRAAFAAEPAKISLDEALKIAIDNNQQIAMAKKKVEAARGQQISARGAFMPQLSLSGAVMRMNTLSNFTLGSPAMIPVLDVSSGTAQQTPYVAPFPSFSITSDREGTVINGKVAMQWPIFTGFRILNGYSAASMNITANEEDLARMKSEVTFSVRQAFYACLLMKEIVKVSEEAVKTVEEHVKAVHDMNRAGLVSNFDVLRAEVQLSNLRPQMIRARSGLEMARTGLAAVLNLAEGREVEPVGEFKFDEVEADLAKSLEDARNNRPDLKALRTRKEMGSKMVSIAKGTYWPSFALVADYSTTRGAFFPPSDKDWIKGYSAGIAGTYTFFEGLSNYGKVVEARETVAQAEAGESLMLKGIEVEVRSAVLELTTAREVIKSQEKAIEQATESLKIARTQYRMGEATNLDVLDAQVSLTQAEVQNIQARHDYIIAQAKLAKALGRE